LSSEKKKNLAYPCANFQKQRKIRFHLFQETKEHALIYEQREKMMGIHRRSRRDCDANSNSVGATRWEQDSKIFVLSSSLGAEF